MYKKFSFWIIIFFSALIIIYSFSFKYVNSYVKYLFYSKSDLRINLISYNPSIQMVSAEKSNSLILKVSVRDLNGIPVPMASVKLNVTKGSGKVYPDKVRMNQSGESLVSYIPPNNLSSLSEDSSTGLNDNTISITANIFNTDISSNVKFKLIAPPVVLIHGFLASSSCFDNIKEYLLDKGFLCDTIDYESESGIFQSSITLEKFLNNLKLDYLKTGTLVNKFDLIAHSMGGVVTRYYTSSNNYIFDDNVHKIIFIAVPHNGSPWASIGADYFNNAGIRDLIPNNYLFSSIFPSLINKGLNPSIQIGSLLDQYDEVVTPESASLDEWNIPTEVFYVGESTLTVDNFLSGAILVGANHQKILNNKKVFDRVLKMLVIDLPYPTIRR